MTQNKSLWITFGFLLSFLCGIMSGFGFQKPPIEVVESPIVFHVEEGCYMYDGEAGTQIKNLLTVSDLEKIL